MEERERVCSPLRDKRCVGLAHAASAPELGNDHELVPIRPRLLDTFTVLQSPLLVYWRILSSFMPKRVYDVLDVQGRYKSARTSHIDNRGPISNLAVNQHILAHFYFDPADSQKQVSGIMVRSLISRPFQQCDKVLKSLETLFSSCENGQRCCGAFPRTSASLALAAAFSRLSTTQVFFSFLHPWYLRSYS
jgi:hypothetical protein